MADFQKRIYEKPTIFNCEDNGTWLFTSLKNDLNLVYIKTRNTFSGMIELFFSSPIDNFQTFKSYTTGINAEEDGTWSMLGNDLFYIKTNNTATGYVEVHGWSGDSGYSQSILHQVTVFKNENDGYWSLRVDGKHGSDFYTGYHKDNVNLCFIKTGVTDTGNVEIHIASGHTDFTEVVFRTFVNYLAPVQNGIWQFTNGPFYDGDGVFGYQLSYIQINKTNSGMVEVTSDFWESTPSPIVSTFAEENNGTWLLNDFYFVDLFNNGIPAIDFSFLDLIYIKTMKTETGKVEIHVAGS